MSYLRATSVRLSNPWFNQHFKLWIIHDVISAKLDLVEKMSWVCVPKMNNKIHLNVSSYLYLFQIVISYRQRLRTLLQKYSFTDSQVYVCLSRTPC